MSLEETLQSWGQGPGASEQERCDNAVAAVQSAIAGDPELARLTRVSPQGSYRARTNIRRDSDVDVCVLDTTSFYYDLPVGMTRVDAGIVPASRTFPEYREQVGRALARGIRGVVTPGDKAFHVSENTYRVEADVLPAWEYRRYTGRRNEFGQPVYLEGIAFLTRDGHELIENWPDQTHSNGDEKHARTYRLYKKHVRILKRLRGDMQASGVLSVKSAPSFPLESLVWNVPDIALTGSYTDGVREVLRYTWNRTKPDQDHGLLKEVNGIKSIFGAHQPWTPDQAHSFLGSAWTHLGL